MKVAIIGTGISGLGAAYLLAKNNDVVVYEKNGYMGGHSRTISVEKEGVQTLVDTGFIVFNDLNYPNLNALFRLLNVPFEASDMSFSFTSLTEEIEYSSENIFPSGKNLLSPRHWSVLYDVLKFNRQARRFINDKSGMTLEECLQRLRVSEWFKEYYIYPMGASI